MMNSAKKINTSGLLGIGSGIAVLFSTVVFMLSKAGSSEAKPVIATPTPTATQQLENQSTTTALPSTITPTTTNTSNLKNGTYTSTVSYNVPHGSTDSITVTATIANGVITDVKNAHYAADRESQSYQNWFELEYKPLVIGKTPTNVLLSRIGGASLTTNAFNRAISNIQVKAKG